MLKGITIREILNKTFFKNRKLYIPAAKYVEFMTTLKDEMLWLIRQDSTRRVAAMANQYPHALPEEREAIQAGLDFERWLAETCKKCLE